MSVKQGPVYDHNEYVHYKGSLKKNVMYRQEVHVFGFRQLNDDSNREKEKCCPGVPISEEEQHPSQFSKLQVDDNQYQTTS